MTFHPRSPRSGRRQVPRWSLLGLGALLLVGCGATDDATAGLEPTLALRVVGTDALAFEPAAYAVPAGDAIELVLESEPGVEHDFVVEGAGGSGNAFPQESHGDHDHAADELPDDLHIAHAEAGEQVRSLFTILEPGVYEVYCSIPGHRAAGMTATLAIIG